MNEKAHDKEDNPFGDFVEFLNNTFSPSKKNVVTEIQKDETVDTQKTCDIAVIWNTIVCLPPMVPPADTNATPHPRPKRDLASEKMKPKKKTLDEEYEEWLKKSKSQTETPLTPSASSSIPPCNPGLSNFASPLKPSTAAALAVEATTSTATFSNNNTAVEATANIEQDITRWKEEEKRNNEKLQLQKLRDAAKESRQREESSLQAMIAEREAVAAREAVRVQVFKSETKAREETERVAREKLIREKKEALELEIAQRDAAILAQRKEEEHAKLTAELKRIQEEEIEAKRHAEEEHCRIQQEAARRNAEEAARIAMEAEAIEVDRVKARERDEAAMKAQIDAQRREEAAVLEREARARAEEDTRRANELKEKEAALARERELHEAEVAAASKANEEKLAAAAAAAAAIQHEEMQREREKERQLEMERAQERGKQDAAAAAQLLRDAAETTKTDENIEQEPAKESGWFSTVLNGLGGKKDVSEPVQSQGSAVSSQADSSTTTSVDPVYRTLVAILAGDGLQAGIYLPNREGQLKLKDVVLKGKQSSGSLTCEFWSKDKKKKLKFHVRDILSVGAGMATPSSLPPSTSQSSILHIKLSGKPELNISFADGQSARDNYISGFTTLSEKWRGIE